MGPQSFPPSPNAGGLTVRVDTSLAKKHTWSEAHGCSSLSPRTRQDAAHLDRRVVTMYRCHVVVRTRVPHFKWHCSRKGKREYPCLLLLQRRRRALHRPTFTRDQCGTAAHTVCWAALRPAPKPVSPTRGRAGRGGT